MAVLVLGAAGAKAQDLSYGVKAGVQQNTFLGKSKDGDKERSQSGGIGFHVGVFADYSLSDEFSVQPQLLFTSKGVVDSKDDKTNLYAIDLPVNFVYKHEGFFAGIGPSFSYGISAKSKSGNNDTDLYKKYDVFGAKASVLKRFEIGANAILGYQFSSGFMLSANYMQGLSNLSDYGSDHVKSNTRYVGLSVGYLLSGGK